MQKTIKKIYINEQLMEEFKIYENEKGKTNSMYIYVLYNCNQEKIVEHIKKQLESIDKISDSYKRKMYSARYFMFRDMVQQNEDNHIYNNVIFISETLSEHKLTQISLDILKKYDHYDISFTYNDTFDLEYLEDLIFNDNPYNIYRINNNKIDYLKLTKTKKKVMDSYESKQLDINEFISKTLPPNTKYIMHGVSAKLKNYIDDRAYSIITKHVRDEDIINMIDQIDQENILIALDNDLLMMNDSKQMDKVVFKNNILTKIKNGQLEKMYIDEKLHNKFCQNMKKLGFDINFKIFQINTKLKSFNENREKIIDNYQGVVGITYY